MLKPSQRNLKLYSHKPRPSPVEAQLHIAEVEHGPAQLAVLEKNETHQAPGRGDSHPGPGKGRLNRSWAFPRSCWGLAPAARPGFSRLTRPTAARSTPAPP